MHKYKNRHRLRSVWRSMLKRCYDPDSRTYPTYGGQGIGVCDRWRKSYDNFYEDMAPTYQKGLWIDRIDNTKGYSPQNCRWLTAKESNRNKRNNTFIDTPQGKMTISNAAEIAGVSPPTMKERIRRGRPTETILAGPYESSRPPYKKTVQTSQGELSISKAAALAGVHRLTIEQRIKNGWGKDRLLLPPQK